MWCDYDFTSQWLPSASPLHFRHQPRPLVALSEPRTSEANVLGLARGPTMVCVGT